MRRFVTLCCLCICMSTTAQAADGDTYYVKYFASDPAAICAEIAEEEFAGASCTYTSPTSLKEDVSLSIKSGSDIHTVTLQIVYPELKAQDIPIIESTDANNASATTLATYAYGYRDLEQVSDAYDDALGTAPVFQLPKYSFTSVYEPKGAVYTMDFSYMSLDVTQYLQVVETSTEAPDVYIDDDKLIQSDVAYLEFALDEDATSWTKVASGAAVPSTYYGQYLYFRVPSSSYADVSEATRVKVRSIQSAPSVRPTLTSTSFSITITNADDYDDCEFSINGTSYYSKDTFTGLSAGTTYTIYVRYEESSSYFYSTAVSTSIATKASQSDAITYSTVSNANTKFFLAEGLTNLTLSGTTLYATFDDDVLDDLYDAVTVSSKSMTSKAVLNVYMQQEDGDTREVKKVSFEIDDTSQLERLYLHTQFGTIVTDDGSDEIWVQHVTSPSSYLDDMAEDAAIVCRVYTEGDDEITVQYPWDFPERSDLDGLRVMYSDTSYDTIVEIPYCVTSEGITFVLPDDGYFSITNLLKEYGTIPFSDCQSHWAYSYVHWAYSTGYMVGVSDNEFDADGVVTRAQLALMLMRLSDAVGVKYDSGCIDVDSDSWYADAVGYLYENNIIPSEYAYSFGPNEPITREEAATLICRATGMATSLQLPLSCTDRSSISTYALNSVDILYNLGVLYGDDTGKFNPQQTLTRGEFATILYRVAYNL